MENFDMLVDLYLGIHRQGPGSDEATLKALELAGLGSEPIQMADIGCGTGAATVLLAQNLNARITAVDLFAPFLQKVEEQANQAGVAQNITTLSCSMTDLPFPKGELDVIWSEGAIYNMGFESGIKTMKDLLKPGGKLVVSEITWLTSNPPKAIREYWQKNYAEIGTAGEKVKVLEDNGYTLDGFFTLPQDCWHENYYQPLQKWFPDFLEKYNSTQEALDLVKGTQEEIAIYEKYSSYYSYGFYIARKL